MFWFKSCPKCGVGDPYASRDHYGPYIACLQCGHYLTQVEEVVLHYGGRTGSRPRLRAEVRCDGPVPAGKSLAGVG